MKTIVGISLLLLCLTACDTSTRPDFEETGAESRMSIAHLKSLCVGTATHLTEDLVIRGVVTANDVRGEFPRTLVVEDATAGISIAIDHTSLFELFPLGAAVTVHCNGLALGDYGGKIQLGAPPSGDYSVDRIARTQIGRHIRSAEPNGNLRCPRTVTPDQITIADADAYLRLEDVRFVEQDTTWCDRDSVSGRAMLSVRRVIDRSGTLFPIRIPASVHYATEPMPLGMGSVNGIVDYFNGELSLRIINYEVDFPTSAMFPRACLSTAEYSSPTRTR